MRQRSVRARSLLALRSICRDPTVRQLTLPILNRFYGPSAYPSLMRFPGCLTSNSRQATQAPGLLNCTALGAEVQTCQANRRRVLLSVRADGPGSVGGDTNFGDPDSDAAPWAGYNANGSAAAPGVFFPNLFDERHVPSAFALTLFSLFGEGKTERADLRPLGPDTPAEDGINWVTRPLGEEVVIDGFDVQVPRDWQGTYQEGRFNDLVSRLGELNDEAWTSSGAKKGGPGDLGVDGKGVVYQGWNKKRSVQRVVMVGGFEVLVE
ncbi:carbohydrate metabolic process [Ascochyta rabiei]|uniref:Carbohydrate metabolic process n=1 Tax=Didymella rabiei TaxID=5454 RepID=A0A163LS18_DIDRA|nr:carbohydrate metabolic process [Ascochyta rabiei]